MEFTLFALWHPMGPFVSDTVCVYIVVTEATNLLLYDALFVTVMLPDNNRFKSITMAAPLEQ